jgi:hypothetical protein
MRMRGLIFAIPLSLLLWGAAFAAVRGAVPPQDRHAIKAGAHHMLARVRRHVVGSLGPTRRG